jgi:hypothetical protein
MSLQAAIAHVLVDDELRRELASNPERLRNEFSLSGEEMRLLCSTDPLSLDRMAHSIRQKRLEFLKRGLPRTTQSISPQVLAEFTRSTIPRSEEDEEGRVLAEGRRLVPYLRSLLAGQVAPHVVDLAEFELVRAELSFSTEVSASAESHPTQSSECLQDQTVVQLVKHARICTFRYDVLALCLDSDNEPGGVESENVEKNEVVPRRISVLLVKDPGRPTVQTYRIGQAVCALLNVCSTPQRLFDLYVTVDSGDADQESHRAKISGSVRAALERGVLLRGSA